MSLKKFFLSVFIGFLLLFNLFSLENDQKSKYSKEPLPYDYDLFNKNTEVVFVNAGFLYWSSQAPGLEYAFKYDNLTNNATVYGVGKYKMSSYDWDPGFRVAIGWFNACKYWQVFTEFTSIKIEGENSAKRTSDTIVATFPQLEILGNELSLAKSHLKLNYNLLDLFVSRVFVPNPHMRLRVMGGFTAGEIEQKWNILYTDVADHHEYVFNKWKFNGIGFRVGFDIDWYWGNNIYVSAKTLTGPLIGKYRYNSSISSDVSNDYFDLSRFKEYRGIYNIQFILGPSYQKVFCKKRIELFGGYEINGWVNLHEINRNSSSSQLNILATEKYPTNINGMLFLDGLTARLTLDF